MPCETRAYRRQFSEVPPYATKEPPQTPGVQGKKKGIELQIKPFVANLCQPRKIFHSFYILIKKMNVNQK